LKFNRRHQVLVCVGDLNVLGEKINATKRNTEALLEASRKVCLVVNKED
jgi:hypothetical protein